MEVTVSEPCDVIRVYSHNFEEIFRVGAGILGKIAAKFNGNLYSGLTDKSVKNTQSVES